MQTSSPSSYVFFQGTVETTDIQAFNVIVVAMGSQMLGIPERFHAQPLSNTFGTILGFKQGLLPQPGSNVFGVYCASMDAGYILGVIQQPDQVPSFPLKTFTGSTDALSELKNRLGRESGQSQDTARSATFNGGRPADITEFEHVYANELGILLGLYPLFQQLKASELAQIQVHLLDDLVKIISHNFSHVTSLGEFTIKQDGNAVDLELGWSHIPGEANGVISPNGKPSFTKDDTANQPLFKTEDGVMPWERMKLFVGRLGGMLRMFMCRPNDDRSVNGDNAQDNPTSGLFDIHVSQDGGLAIRSISHIFLEKTQWIRVPERKLQCDDPTGDEPPKWEDIQAFKWDDTGLTSGALCMRQALAWISEKLPYENFKKLPKEFVVNDDVSKQRRVGKVDDQFSISLQTIMLSRTGIYLMPTGGLIMRDSSGSAFIMENGHIALQPVKDVHLQPFRHLVAKVGGSTSIACQNDIDLSSTVGWIRGKADKSIHLYSVKNGVVLQSDSENLTNPQDPGETDPDPGFNGVVLVSKGAIQVAADKYMTFQSEDFQGFKAKTFITETEDVWLIRSNRLFTYSTGMTQFLSDGDLFCQASGSSAFGGAGATILGMKDQTIAYTKAFGGPVYGIGDPQKVMQEVDEQLQEKTYDKIVPVFKTAEEVHRVKFRFPSSKWFHLSDEFDFMHRHLGDIDNDLHGQFEMNTWSERQVNGTYPFPGQDLIDSFMLTCKAPAQYSFNEDWGLVPDVSNPNGEASTSRTSLSSIKTTTTANGS